MPIVQVLYLVALVVVLVFWLLRGAKVPPTATAMRAPAVATLSMILHIVVDPMHWTLYPVYVVTLLHMVNVRRAVLQRAPATRGQRASAALFLVLLAPCALLAYALPVPNLPTPTGEYEMGTFSYQLDDPARTDPYAPTPGQTRKIMLQVWYPASPARKATPAPWSRDIGVFGPAIARYFGLPPFFLNHLGALRSHAYENAPARPAEGGWPVLVYSHGWTGFRTVALDEIEALVSHGYVVAAPDHTYGALATVLADGTPVLNNPKAMPPDEPKDARQVGIELLVDTYAGDLRLVLDELQRLQSGERDTPVRGQIDLAKLGLFGHSTGGGAIYEVAATDPRVKAAFGLDTWTEPISAEVRAKPLTVPFYSLRSAAWAERDDAKAQILRQLLGQAQAKTYDVYLSDSKHNDFTLMPILSPFAGIFGVTGPIDGRRALEITNAYLVAFFEHTLRGKPSPLLDDGATVYPEVRPVR